VLGLAFPRAATAQIAGCIQPAPVSTVRAAPIDSRAAALPGPLAARAAPADLDGIIQQATSLVREQLGRIDAAPCFTAQLSSIADRIVLLSPTEFLIAGHFGREPARRAELLALYRDDPAASVRQLAPFWPSSSAEMLLSSRAFYDLDLRQIVVNTAATKQDTLLTVLVHEHWHALANVRQERDQDGQLYRVSGFYREARIAEGGWRPIEEYVDGRVPTFLLNEVVAMEMEREATGQQPPARDDIRRAFEELYGLFDALGQQQLLELYLTSTPEVLPLARAA
jgi:hypothetical protein